MAFYLAFLAYIIFFLIAVLNTLTGIFLDAACQNASNDQQMVITEELRKKSTYVKRFTELWDRLDEDQSGDITLEELEHHLKSPELIAFMSNLDIDINDIVQFFDALSDGGKITVDPEIFVEGCLKLKGLARSVDLFGLIQMFKQEGLQQSLRVNQCLAEINEVRRQLTEQPTAMMRDFTSQGCFRM